MPSQFFGLNIGASALTAFQASINTVANNISNVQTEGYSRQETTLEASAAIRVHTKYGSAGTGVTATQIIQQRDLYYDEKYWQNNSSLGLYEEKLYYLEQVESILQDDETQNGFATIFSSVFNALDTLKNNAGDESVRNQFIHQAQGLCTYFNAISNSLTTIQEDCNEEIKTTVEDINSIAKKLSLMNKEINNIEIAGGYANELRDERANLLDRLSKMVSVETNEYEVKNTYGENLGGTNLTVIINGQVLVDGNDYRQLRCESKGHLMNQTDAEGMYYIKWEDTGTDFAAATASAGGTLKALFEIRDGNNNAGMTGIVRAEGTDTRHITLTSPSVTDMNSLNIPEKGEVTIKNRTYAYSGWSAEIDENGKITAVTYNLIEEIDPLEANVLADKQIICGKNVDSMGIPYYQQQINEFIRTFTQMFNDIEKKGVDLEGNEMGAFFVARNKTDTQYEFNEWEKDENGTYPNIINSKSDSYYQLTAANIAIHGESLKNPARFSTTADIINGADAYELAEQLMTLQKDVNMFRGDNASAFLEKLISDTSVDTEKNTIYCQNYSNLEISIGNHRTSVSGVDEDEEGINLIKFQNAYNMASKVISVLNEIYNKLINETGVS